MTDTLRPYDYVGRYGGEEFLVLVTTEGDHALDPFERIRIAIADKPFLYEGVSIDVTTSCGVAVFAAPQYGDDDSALIGAADKALYQAKEGGRNRTILSETSAAAPEDEKVKRLK